MLIVGQISSVEEQHELRFIAELVIIGDRIRYLARQTKKENK